MKYLRVKIDEQLTWKPHIDGKSAKLNKANAMLSKIRHFVDQKTLKAIYHDIFESHLYSCSLVWHRILILQKDDCLSYKKSTKIYVFLKKRITY